MGTCVVLILLPGVGADGVPVNVGLAFGASELSNVPESWGQLDPLNVKISPLVPVQTKLIVPVVVMGFVPESVTAPQGIMPPFTSKPALVRAIELAKAAIDEGVIVQFPLGQLERAIGIASPG